MAFVDRNSKHVLNRLLMFTMDLYVLLRRTGKANLVASLRAAIRERP